MSGYERRLTRAKLLFDEALHRSQEGSGPSNWKDYLYAHAAFQRAERDLAQANDEVFGGHPLTGKGFAGYGAYTVANSMWLAEEMRIQSVHRGFDPARWKNTRHYLLAFHDEMLECLAEDHRLHALDMSMANALEVAQKRLVADWD